MGKHTPTPWREAKVADGIIADTPVERHDAEDPCVVQYYGGHLVAESMNTNDRRFILKACNSYDDLIGTLEDCVDALIEFIPHDHPYQKIINQARAALASTEGEQN